MKILFSILTILCVNLAASQNKTTVQKTKPHTSNKKVGKKIQDFRTPPSYYVITKNETGVTDTVMLLRLPGTKRD